LKFFRIAKINAANNIATATKWSKKSEKSQTLNHVEGMPALAG
jgi:hypothetical protein